MGPPKRRQKKVSYIELKRRYDCFEYRWNTDNQNYYLFNPYTGETMFNTNLDMIDRATSMWAKPEKYPSDDAQHVTLYPEFYAARRWGRRRFNGWESPDAAASHIATVARGFLTRLWLRSYYRNRYHTMTCQFSGYYYFVDKLHPDAETSWYKPRLAFPDDIQPFVEHDPEDYMKGTKYSKMDITKGPFMRVSGLSKYTKQRTHQPAFLISNPWRDQAINDYKDVDLNAAPLGTVIAWLEGDRTSSLKISEFHLMRAAICDGDWTRVLFYMKEHPDNLVIQIYGFHCFAKSEVPLDVSGVIDYVANEVMEMCVDLVRDEARTCDPTLKIFATSAFYNILSVRPGRLEYLNTDLVTEQGELRHAAVEAFLAKRLSIFNNYLSYIPSETFDVYEKGAKNATQIQRPLQRAVDLIEVVMKCLCVLAHESETKEQMAFILVEKVLFCLGICQDEAYIMLHGLQFFYNLCYRCESGQEAILACCNPADLIETVTHNHSGDPDVMRQCRRLELALKHNGWRGMVENLITKEMRNERLDDEYLQVASFQKK